MKIIPSSMAFQDSKLNKIHTYSEGNSVPIFDVCSFNGLNQIIGYAKYINPDKKILYRGECRLHNSMRPSINHTISSQNARDKANNRINKMITDALSDDAFSKYIRLSKTNDQDRFILESVLQHYGIATHCIDVVDNHWVALWFGQNECIKRKMLNTYFQYQSRKKNIYELIDISKDSEDLYQYVVLLATEFQNESSGISITNTTITIDLRSAVPSTFLRPHAQHGWIIRKNTHRPDDNYDLAENVIGIIRIRTDLAAQWLGNGKLLSVENLFPSPAFDQGYDVLLSRKDLFEDAINTIAKYIY